MSLQMYFARIANAIMGTEGFVVSSDGLQVKPNPAQLVEAFFSFFIWIVLIFIFYFATSYGAARLSYCYNISIGNTSDIAFVYSILCFFFSGIYYPFYALFLNPLCVKKPASFIGGGRLKGWF